MCFIYKKKDC
jgi:ribosomal protein S15P/S13E